jgi:hypothetical protein
MELALRGSARALADDRLGVDDAKPQIFCSSNTEPFLIMPGSTFAIDSIAESIRASGNHRSDFPTNADAGEPKGHCASCSLRALMPARMLTKALYGIFVLRLRCVQPRRGRTTVGPIPRAPICVAARKRTWRG